jgi:uncharacterized protein (DUF2062 family)
MIVAALSAMVILLCSAGLLLALGNRWLALFQAPPIYRALGVVFSSVLAVFGLGLPIALLGPLGILVGVPAAALGIELGLALTLYHVWVREWYLGRAQRVLERKPKLKDTSLARLIDKEKRQHRESR